MSGLKAVLLSAATKLTGAAAGEDALDAKVRGFLLDHGVAVRALKALDCEENRRVYFGETKIDGLTCAVIVSADPDLGAVDGAVVSNVTGAQLQLARYEWSYSIASCIRFYDHLLDRLNVHRRLTGPAETRRTA